MDLNRINDSPIAKEYNVSLKNYNTFKVGGYCPVMLFPKTKSQFFESIDMAGDEYFILGNGSNVLISDSGFDGVVINTRYLNKIQLTGNILTCECGAKMSDIVALCTKNSFGGLESFCQIPGSIGATVVRNGGCFNKSIGDSVLYVVSRSGIFNRANCRFEYRNSRFIGDAVYLVGLKVYSCEYEEIEEKILKYQAMRKQKQPKGNTCGSVFLNEGFFAGKIIDQAGLKGFSIGGACVSKEHANFIVNNGGSAKDIYDLINHIKKIVFEKFNIELNEEVQYIGRF